MFVFIWCVDINECLSDPCQNDGTCNDTVNGFVCDCADGYQGEQCGEGKKNLRHLDITFIFSLVVCRY